MTNDHARTERLRMIQTECRNIRNRARWESRRQAHPDGLPDLRTRRERFRWIRLRMLADAWRLKFCLDGQARQVGDLERAIAVIAEAVARFEGRQRP